MPVPRFAGRASSRKPSFDPQFAELPASSGNTIRYLTGRRQMLWAGSFLAQFAENEKGQLQADLSTFGGGLGHHISQRLT